MASAERNTRSQNVPPIPDLTLNVLIVEDDDVVSRYCASIAEYYGSRIEVVASVREARSYLSSNCLDVVFLDLHLPDGRGDLLLEQIRSEHPHVHVVIMTSKATVNLAVDLLHRGANDLLQKPIAPEIITRVLEEASVQLSSIFRPYSPASGMRSERVGAALVGRSNAMQRLFRLVRRIGLTRHPVLIVGERGTGKETIARAIHASGANTSAPFVPVDCDALLPFQIEAALLGRDRSRYPTEEHTGLLTLTSSPTIFLSEIGRLGLDLQAKLVRALAEGRVTALGQESSGPLTARIIASSSENLNVLVDEGRFRRDLHYRLNVTKLDVPSLRDRKEDILPLIEHFLKKKREENGISYRFTKDASFALERYAWPGNVEELESLVESLCSISSYPQFEFCDLPLQIQTVEKPDSINTSTVAVAEALPTLEQIERRAIEKAMALTDGNVILAAKSLGIGKTTLYRKLKEHRFAVEGHF